MVGYVFCFVLNKRLPNVCLDSKSEQMMFKALGYLLYCFSFLSFIYSIRIKVPGTLCGISPALSLCDAIPVGIEGQTYDNGQGRSPKTCDRTSANSFCPYGMVTYGYGRNQYGQLGLGNKVDRLTPTPLATAYAKVRMLESSAHSSYLVWAGINTMYSWGRSDQGQLGQVRLQKRKATEPP